MKTIVVYQSSTGFTKKYAQWIAEELSCDLADHEAASKKISDYDVIIYGGGITAGRIAGLDKLKKNPHIYGKKLILFATGATDRNASKIINSIRDNNLSQQEQESIPFYYFESGINYENMGFFSKTLLKGMCKSLQKKKDRTDEETGMMNALMKSNDHSDKALIKPLITYVKGVSI
ncbi:MAG TPA: hypothetical protein GXX75_06700 [Clostridiales bacterium]|nr:hypothetical protein [Clostridiales bacterium]